MPTIPIYSTPQVAPQGLPGVRQQAPQHLMSAATLGPQQMSDFGKGVLSAGTEMMRQITAQQIQENEASSKEYDAKLMGGIQGVLYGTPDNPDAGFINQKGKNALDAYQATVEKLGSLGNDLSQDLKNPAQQEMVKTMTMMRVQSAVVQATEHRAKQNEVYQVAAGETRIKVAQDGAAQAFNPITDKAAPDFNHDELGANSQYQQYLKTIDSEANDLADRKGLTDPDLRKAMVKGVMEKAYLGVLSHLIDKKGGTPADMAVAQQYFDTVKGELSTESQDKVKAVLQAGAIKDKALALALDVQQSEGSLNSAEGKLNDMFKEGKINAEVHGMALQHLRADDAQRKGYEQQQVNSFMGQTWDDIRTGKLRSLTQLTPEKLNFIIGHNLGGHIDQMLKKADGTAVPNFKLYADLMRMSAEDPSAFIKQDLSMYYGTLTDAHLNHLIGLQTSVNRGDLKAMETTKVINGAVQTAKASMLASGLNLNPKPGTQQAKDLEAFNASLYDVVLAEQAAHPDKPVTPARARELTLGLLKDQALSGSGWFGSGVGQTHMPVWKMTPEQRDANWEIPAGERQQIMQSLIRAKVPTTEVNIQRAYKAKQGVQ